jgi:hypothetical protein
MSGTTSTTTSGATGQFQIVNGQIINPNGGVFTAQGVNLYDSQMGDASTVLADFPAVNFIRLNVYSYQSPSAYASFIQTMTSKGIVVELEDHTNSTGSNAGGGQGSAFTGSQLSNEQNWYSTMASAYASNPYVWFGTDNEPPQGGLSTWEQQTYNTIRNAGNNNPIMMELPGGGYPGNTASAYGMDPSVYTSMSNIVLDAHYYGWASGYSTDQQTVNSTLTSLVQGAQSITSANGTVPVIIGEYGPSTDGQSTDQNGNQVLQAVQSSTVTSGSVAWGFNAGANDNLTNADGTLTSFGQEVAQWMSSTGTTPAAPTTATPTPTPTPTPTATPTATPTPTPTPTATSTATPSANDTTVALGSNAAITDASGNQWTIASTGQVAVNGVGDTTTANVVQLAYVNGTIWQENSSGLWWGETSPTASWSGTAGTSTSPLPATSTPTPTPTPTSPAPAAAASPNDTMVLAGSTTAITDASGNAWTIASNGQVAVNGTADTTTANVTELGYVNGTVWQENSNNLWWSKTSPTGSWSPSAGTATSPLPATVTIAPNSSSATVSQSQISVAATSGTNMLFVTGSNDVVSLSGGSNTVTDTGSGNTYILPAASQGSADFTSNILNTGDTLDLKPALAATDWNGNAATLANYVTLTDSPSGAVLSVASTSGGAGTAIATIGGATSSDMSTLLAHSIT